MKEKVYINGDFVDSAKARISVADLGLNYGYGLFETISAYNGEPYLLDEHLKRLAYGAGVLLIHSPHLKKFTKGAAGTSQIKELLRLNGLSESSAYIKIIVTKGIETKNATIIIFAKASETGKLAGLRKRGVKAILVNEPARYRPEIKNLNYMPNILARNEAKKSQAYDALFKTGKDLILEGSASNIFIVKGRCLITPKTDGTILPGITREKVIKLATTDGLCVNIGPIKRSELINSDEAFLTNSIIEIAPLVKIDSQRVALGLPGEITKRIQRLYQESKGVK